ncbi:MAG TPA: hypothetical protein VK131_12650, partial [Candidatus Acidoferrales bacterium]|nr:hypothetical protein [Candidatus Acidoferrales bacterium]
MVLLIGPLIAVIGILVAVYVLRGKAAEKRSLYSAQRDRLAHKVQEARERTLAPIARAEKEAEKREKEAEKKASRHGHGAPAEAPAAKSAWEYSPTAPAPSAPMEPSSTRAGEPAWTPTSAPPSAPPPPPLPPVPAPTPA